MRSRNWLDSTMCVSTRRKNRKSMDFIKDYWAYLVPLVVVQLALQIAATVSLVGAARLRCGSKAIWAVVIWAFQALGPIAYFALGREE